MPYKDMRNTKQLSAALTKIQEEAMERIRNFFKNKSYTGITFKKNELLIYTGSGKAYVRELNNEIDIFYTQGNKRYVCREKDCEPLPADALLTILDELERMEKTNQ